MSFKFGFECDKLLFWLIVFLCDVFNFEYCSIKMEFVIFSNKFIEVVEEII